MQSSTLIVLACVLAVVMAAQQHYYPELEDIYQSEYTPEHDNSPRTKRSLLLLKKKLLLGVLGLKAAKVGAAGVAGALALKSKGHHKTHEIKIHSHDALHGSIAHHHDHHQIHQSPHSFVEVHEDTNSALHSWSG